MISSPTFTSGLSPALLSTKKPSSIVCMSVLVFSNVSSSNLIHLSIPPKSFMVLPSYSSQETTYDVLNFFASNGTLKVAGSLGCTSLTVPLLYGIIPYGSSILTSITLSPTTISSFPLTFSSNIILNDSSICRTFSTSESYWFQSP